jgi:hypothetical protein
MIDYSQKRAGVYFETQDNSQYDTGTIVASTALITPTVKGKAFQPRVVSTMSEYANYFGTAFKSGSQYYEYQGSLLAQLHFENGGQPLLVVPIKSGSYASATSNIPNPTSGSFSFTLETLSEGSIMNNIGGEIANSNGTLVSGSSNNVRWEVSNSNATKGTFDLTIRRGDDNNKNKTVLESYSGLSLDPTNQNFVSNVIGDVTYNYDATNKVLQKVGSYNNKSKLVRVSAINATPDYLDNAGVAKAIFTGSFPINGSGSFSGGTDGTISHPQLFGELISGTNSQGFTASTDAYDKAIDLLSNKDEYKFSVLYTSGVTANTHPTIVQKALDMVIERDDCFYVIDPSEYGKQPSEVITVASGFDTDKGAMYYPHSQIRSANLNKDVWVLPSTVVAGAIAYSDSVSSPSFAPAGYNRASLSRVRNVQQKVGSSLNKSFFNGNVNLIEPMSGLYVILSQNTLKQKSTALDRVNVVRMLINVKDYISEEGRKILFEANIDKIRTLFVQNINNYLGKLIEKGEIAFGKISTIEDNASFDRSEFPLTLEITPAKSIEKIIVRIVINETGVTFQ